MWLERLENKRVDEKLKNPCPAASRSAARRLKRFIIIKLFGVNIDDLAVTSFENEIAVDHIVLPQKIRGAEHVVDLI